jgi:hypothetical protein
VKTKPDPEEALLLEDRVNELGELIRSMGIRSFAITIEFPPRRGDAHKQLDLAREGLVR